MKIFYNDRKIPIIPPLLIIDEFETEFKKKAHHFNVSFASKHTVLINNSVIPNSFDYISTARLSSINIINADKLKIIKSLNVNKGQGRYISVRMIKLCGQSIVKPLSIIFKNCIDNSIFPDIWKKSNVIPVHKKGVKQIIDNFKPVSLLSICGKIFEKLLFSSKFKFLDDNNVSSNQPGFRPSNSCEYQLLSIVHDIYASFECCPSLKVRGIFLNISKAFDRVWHEGLL